MAATKGLAAVSISRNNRESRPAIFELSLLGARGVRPDPATAKVWYERARQLGATEAEERLKRLGSR